MQCSPRSTLNADEQRDLEAARFLVRSGLLPSPDDDEFCSRLKFALQARRLGLSLADLRRLLEVGKPAHVPRRGVTVAPVVRVSAAR